MEDQRASPRRRVLKTGQILFNGAALTRDCTVRDMSETGARLKVAHVAGVPDRFILSLGEERREVACEVRWRTLNQLGVAFVPETTSAAVPAAGSIPPRAP